MKSLIVLVVGLLSVGCATVKDIYVQLVGGKPNTPEQKQKALRDSVVGEYEFKPHNGYTEKLIFLDNGIREFYRNGKKEEPAIGIKEHLHHWHSKNGEIHVKYDSGGINVYRINKDKSITYIARISPDGKRIDDSENQYTFKKIK